MACDYKCSDPEKEKEENDLGGECKVGRRSDKPQESIMSLVIRKTEKIYKKCILQNRMAVLISAGWSSLNLPFQRRDDILYLGKNGITTESPDILFITNFLLMFITLH